MCLSAEGGKIHSAEALIAKSRVTVLSQDVFFHGQEGTWRVKNSERYLGARPFKALKSDQ